MPIRVLPALPRRVEFIAPSILGTVATRRTVMIATTVSSSMSVNPELSFLASVDEVFIG
jgi:hypothetical protein